ncbi:hypothetical protein TcCL_ESM09520 [Trypanosoma cruzi]|nr:hypothetical protein TcCL_ESM09520 [Trypanosoma cruzi]
MIPKIMEKHSSAHNQGSCPSAVPPLHQCDQRRHLGQHCGVPPQISDCVLGKVERIDVHRQRRDHVWVPIVCLHNLSRVSQRTPFCGMRRLIPRSQGSLHVGSRQIRELLVVSKCPA